MGGYGSGRQSGFSKKPITENLHRIDSRWFRRQGYLRPGVMGSVFWSWGDKQTGFCDFSTGTDSISINYRYQAGVGEWGTKEQKIYFERTPCHYGGERIWLVCPHCQKRVAILYGGTAFYCRHCYNLAYSSQRERKRDRLLTKVTLIRKRLGWIGDLITPIVLKPKNMHWKTFYRLRGQSEEAHALVCADFNMKTLKLIARLDANNRAREQRRERACL